MKLKGRWFGDTTNAYKISPTRDEDEGWLAAKPEFKPFKEV